MKKRDDESTTEFTMRRITQEIGERCAKIAEAEIDRLWPGDDLSVQARTIAENIRVETSK